MAAGRLGASSTAFRMAVGRLPAHCPVYALQKSLRHQGCLISTGIEYTASPMVTTSATTASSHQILSFCMQAQRGLNVPCTSSGDREGVHLVTALQRHAACCNSCNARQARRAD